MLSIRYLKLICFALVSLPTLVSTSIDEEADTLSQEISDSILKLSKAYNHKVDWVFLVDQGGLTNQKQHDHTKYFVKELTNLLHIAPQLSRVALVTYSRTVATTIPFSKNGLHQCGFNTALGKTPLSTGDSNLEQALRTAESLDSFRNDSHRATVLITTAGWANTGLPPLARTAALKRKSDLMVFVLVFDRALSIMSPVVRSFASPTIHGIQVRGGKLAYEAQAQIGQLRRLYRRLQKVSMARTYIPLQIQSTLCTQTCRRTETCVCDIDLYDTLHCELDSIEPILTSCPLDQSFETDSGSPTLLYSWRGPTRYDYSGYVKENVYIDDKWKLYLPLKSTPFPNGNYESFSTNKHLEVFLPIGSSKIEHVVEDDRGNTANCSYMVTVRDREAPIVGYCPTHIEEYTNGYPYKVITLPDLNVTDNSGEPMTISSWRNNTHMASLLALRNVSIGFHNFQIQMTDQSGNAADCQFTVELIDNEPPKVVECKGPGDIVETTGDVADVNWDEPVFRDNSQSTVTDVVALKIPGTYSLGKHNITFVARDQFGNEASCSFQFTVVKVKSTTPRFTTTPSTLPPTTTTTPTTAQTGWTFLFSTRSTYTASTLPARAIRNATAVFGK